MSKTSLVYAYALDSMMAPGRAAIYASESVRRICGAKPGDAAHARPVRAELHDVVVESAFPNNGGRMISNITG